MSMIIITLKVPKDPAHDPNNKITGTCPLFGGYCDDVTGAHHSGITHDFSSPTEARQYFESKGIHVTRVEQAE